MLDATDRLIDTDRPIGSHAAHEAEDNPFDEPDNTRRIGDPPEL